MTRKTANMKKKNSNFHEHKIKRMKGSTKKSENHSLKKICCWNKKKDLKVWDLKKRRKKKKFEQNNKNWNKKNSAEKRETPNDVFYCHSFHSFLEHFFSLKKSYLKLGRHTLQQHKFHWHRSTKKYINYKFLLILMSYFDGRQII